MNLLDCCVLSEFIVTQVFLGYISLQWCCICDFLLTRPQGGFLNILLSFLAPSFRAILGAAAAFTDVALVRKDGHPPAAHSIILRSVNPLLWKFWNFIRHPNPLISLGGTPELTELSGYYSEMSSLYNMWKDQWQSCITRHTERPAIWPFTEALLSSQPFYY